MNPITGAEVTPITDGTVTRITGGGGDSLLLAGIGKSSQRDQWTGIGHYKLSQVCFRASGCMLTLVSRDSSQSSKYFHASRIKQLDMRGKQKLAY